MPALVAEGRRRLLVSEANHVDHDIEVRSRHGQEGGQSSRLPRTARTAAGNDAPPHLPRLKTFTSAPRASRCLTMPRLINPHDGTPNRLDAAPPASL